jgi:signal transduction histidine kinase
MTLDASQVWGRVARDGSALRTDHLDAGSDRLARSLRQLDARAAVAAPIVVSGRVWGRDRGGLQAYGGGPCGHGGAHRAVHRARRHRGRERPEQRRARGIAAPDRRDRRRYTRRRIERDLHDGAQQRLVHTIITLELARSTLPTTACGASWSAKRSSTRSHAIAETRELAQGIHPAILSATGLVRRARGSRRPLGGPVTLDAHITVACRRASR